MLQRIQTVYLFLSFLAMLFYTYSAYFELFPLIPIFGIAAATMTLLIFINIFLYKNRKWQVKINNLLIFVLIVLLGLSGYHAGLLSGEKSFSEKDIELLIPVISIVFLLIANKYIKRDEKLVKSVDRIR